MNDQWVEKEVSLKELGQKLGIYEFDKPNIVDIDELGLEVLTPMGYKSISTYVVKESSPGYKLGDLIATSNHRVLHNNEWVHVKDMCESIKLDKTINVVDIEVPDGNCYLANGFVNHNTSPGGLN